MPKGDSRGMATEVRRISPGPARGGAQRGGARGRIRLLAGLSAEEEAALRDFEEAESSLTIGPPRIHPSNQGRWPSEEEIAERKRKIRKQLERMKREHPRLYERLPLLHELLAPEPEPERR